MKHFKPILLAILLALVVLPLWGCGGGTHELDPAFDEAALRAKGREMVEHFTASEWDAMQDASHAELAAFFASAENREQLDGLREPLGAFEEFGEAAVSGATDGETGVEFALVLQEAVYENRKTLFTMSFNKDMELAGFYVK